MAASAISYSSFVDSRSHDMSFLQGITAMMHHQAIHHQAMHQGSSIVGSGDSGSSNKRKCGQLRTTSHRKYHHHHARKLKKRRKVIPLSIDETGLPPPPPSSSSSSCCRRYRRRQAQLLLHHSASNSSISSNDNDDASGIVKWLATHIWHRKRGMVMDTRWGYSIPIRSSQYSYNDGMLKRGAVICDRSFIRPIHITTRDSDDMNSLMKRFLDPSSPFMSSDVSRPKEFETLVYSDGKFPHQCMGPVTITYCPSASHDDGVNVWIWTHPAFLASLRRELSTAMLLVSHSGTVAVVSDVVRFSIRGIGSSSVIRKAIDPLATWSDSHRDTNEHFYSRVMDSDALHRVWVDGDILAIDTKDTRYRDVDKEDDVFQANKLVGYKKAPPRLHWPPGLQSAASSLWSHESRQSLADTFVSDNDINVRNGRLRDVNWFVKTSDHSEQSSGSSTTCNDSNNNNNNSNNSSSNNNNNNNSSSRAFPVLLVRKKAQNHRNVYEWDQHIYDGWDIVAPTCFASFLWSRLQFCDAKAVGIDDFNAVQTNAGLSTYPRDFDVTTSMRTDAADNEHSADATNGVIVVREKAYLKPFDPAASSNGRLQVTKDGEHEVLMISVAVPRLPKLQMTTLITVCLVPTSRGVIREGAKIFGMPTGDFAVWSAFESCKGLIAFGRFVGAWKGCQHVASIDKDASSTSSIGVVTSGQQKATRSSRGGIGLCDAAKLRDYFRRSILTGAENNTASLLPSTTNSLVLFRNPSSSWLRPALVKIIAVSE